MSSLTSFEETCRREIEDAGRDGALKALANEFMVASAKYRYTYHFTSLGRPIIQFPQDIVAMQEIIWAVKPDLVIETGIAHGGSLIGSALMLAMLDYCDAVSTGRAFVPTATRRRVLGIDIDIRAANRVAIESHPLSHRIDMLEGSSIDPVIRSKVRAIANSYSCVLVCLDSNHTRQHVLAELMAYAPLVSVGSYCVVFDTSIENSPDTLFADRLWAKGNNPMTAVEDFLSMLAKETMVAADGTALAFAVDSSIDNKLLISTAPNGYLRRTR